MIFNGRKNRLWARGVAQQEGSGAFRPIFQVGLAQGQACWPQVFGEGVLMSRKRRIAYVVAGLLACAVLSADLQRAAAESPLNVSPAVYRAAVGEGAAVQLIHHPHGYGWGGGYRGYYGGGWGGGYYRPAYRPYPVYGAPIIAPPIYSYPVYAYPAYGYGYGYGYGRCW
jgi:hypothetical protein